MNRCGHCEDLIRYDEQREVWTTDATYDHTTAEESADMARQCGLSPDSRHFPVQCSANAGGDPAGGCDNLVEGNHDLCAHHYAMSLVSVDVAIVTSICANMHLTEVRMVGPVVETSGHVHGSLGSSADFCDVCEDTSMEQLTVTTRTIKTTPEMADCYRIRYERHSNSQED